MWDMDSDEELVSLLGEKLREVTRIGFAMKMGRGKSSSALRMVRRDIARVKTELRRRERVGGMPKNFLERRARVGSGRDQSSSLEKGFLAGVVDGLAQND